MRTFELSEATPQINETFQDFTWGLYKAKIGESFISCFVFLIPNEKSLEQNWKFISTRIAALYQTKLTDDYSAWNIYLLFQCETAINRPLQYEIENDKFSMRKIVNCNAPSISHGSAIALLNNEILGASLESRLSSNLPNIDDRVHSELQQLFDEFGAIPEDNKIESKNKREELLRFLLERIS
ncbi:hypothetical protein D9M70_330260 [compost metagenome]